MHNQPWTTAPLVAVDLEGTGSQDRETEAILEVGVVPLDAGRPLMAGSYHSLVNPERHVPRRSWISASFSDDVLASAPPLDVVTPELVTRLDGAYIVGHNVLVDWRLLSLRCPGVRPAALIDTLKLTRLVHRGTRRHSLTALLAHYQLTDEVTQLAGGGEPHRALWDAVGAALLLGTLIAELPSDGPVSVSKLREVAGQPIGGGATEDAPGQIPLLF
ncbi:3'-5' exonuclease [Sphaerisporangium sp. NPDC088356]|uniref:3'-5' exonuclease n=1 Tax=Sphaerisporangium sp. NPDC088356 TaxID=3154871 RepID=UPI003414B217